MKEFLILCRNIKYLANYQITSNDGGGSFHGQKI